MKNKDFLKIFGEIDNDLVQEAEQNVKKVAFSWSKVGIFAASVGILASIFAFTLLLNKDNPNPPPNPPHTVTTLGGTTVQSVIEGDETSTTLVQATSSDPNLWNGQTSFDDLEGFIEHEKELGEKGSGDYYIIPAANEDFELWYIFRQEPCDIGPLDCIDVKYKLKGVEVDPDNYKELRMNTISLRYELMGSTEERLQYLEKQGYEKIEYNGKNMYIKPQTALDDDQILAYHVVFIENGCRIGIHIPAVDTLENLLWYTEIQRVEIK